MAEITWRELPTVPVPLELLSFVKEVGRTINRYHMIQAGDEVLLSVSGGKDSLLLALALSTRLAWLPISYRLRALLIDWQEYPLDQEALETLQAYFATLEIPLEIVQEEQYSSGFAGDFNCYLCSRNRRRVLFTYAQEHNIRLIATGHHLDDLVETSMINLLTRGTFSTMQPVQSFFASSLHLIRPLIECHESQLIALTERYQLPAVKPVCPYDESTLRAKIKPLVEQMVHLDQHAREHIYHSHAFNCALERKS